MTRIASRSLINHEDPGPACAAVDGQVHHARNTRPRRGFVTAVLCALAPACLLGSCSENEPHIEFVQPPWREGWNSSEPEPGFTLVAPLQSTRIYLVDMAGNAVFQWRTELKNGAIYLTDRGTLLTCQRVEDHPIFRHARGHSGLIQEVDWNGDVLWELRWDPERGMNHHDIEQLPNGNLLVVAWERMPATAAIAAGRDPEVLLGDEFFGGVVYEIRPTPPAGAETVWTWRAFDHVIQHRDPSLPNYVHPAARPERIDINGDRDPDPPDETEQAEQLAQMAALGYTGGNDEAIEEEDEEAQQGRRVRSADWLHVNAIDYRPDLDQIALSVRFFDEVWIIDHGLTTEEAAGPKGDLLYRWGNPFAHGMGRWEDRRLFGQHHVQWIDEGMLGAGNLIVFNNGAAPREYSTIDEWWAPRDVNGRYPRAEGRPWGPIEPDWTYVAPDPTSFYSWFISGVQRLPGGNTLVCEGDKGRVFEVTPDGEVVWDWHSPFGPLPDEVDEDFDGFPNGMFRALRYPTDHPGIVALRAKGASIPEDPGTGPPTNQFVPRDGQETKDE